ncbi:hypothetical protein DL93DRAFT_814854 [Clavulina sp. PMI_390]|nr:hypothetical protein DL93DRAFT_814854 [Clavulina sp. PMI_390]
MSIFIRTKPSRFFPDSILHHVLLTLSPELLHNARLHPPPSDPSAHLDTRAQSLGHLRIAGVQSKLSHRLHRFSEVQFSRSSRRGFWLENANDDMRDMAGLNRIMLFSSADVDARALEGINLLQLQGNFPSLFISPQDAIGLDVLFDIGGVNTSVSRLPPHCWEPFASYSLTPQDGTHSASQPEASLNSAIAMANDEREGTLRSVANLYLKTPNHCSFDDSTGRIAIGLDDGRVLIVSLGAVGNR